MTIEREEPGLLVAVCEGCGDRRTLDLEPEAEPAEINAALEELGWERRKPEKVKFPTPFSPGAVHIFEQDYCGDCQSGEPAPRPRFVPGRRPRPSVRDAFANDPHDAWPRELVFEAAGLRRDCGHPPSPGVSECGFCRAGYPIGHTSSWWKRA